MSTPETATATAVDIAAAGNALHLRAVDVVDAALARIAEADTDLRAFGETRPEQARHVARAVDADILPRAPGRRS